MRAGQERNTQTKADEGRRSLPARKAFESLTQESYHDTIIAQYITKKGTALMIVDLSELKTNFGRYVNLTKNQDTINMRNGKQVAKIVGTNRDRVADMESLFGIAILPHEYNDPCYDPDYEKLRDKRVGI